MRQMILLIDYCRRATLARKGMPVCCGTALKNKGVRTVMDLVIDYLPTPAERHHPFVDFYEDDLCALVFKISHDKRRGPLTFARVYRCSIICSVVLVFQSGSNINGHFLQWRIEEQCDGIQRISSAN